MRAVVQRVSSASVAVVDEESSATEVVGAIEEGLLVLLGAGEGDTEAEARWLAHKVANLRIFPDAEGRMNLSPKDVGGSVLLVPQFTLYADTRRGFRPSFVHAAPPEVADPLMDVFVEAVRAERVPVETGVFQAHMRVELVNDGPVTILLEKEAG